MSILLFLMVVLPIMDILYKGDPGLGIQKKADPEPLETKDAILKFTVELKNHFDLL